MPNRKPLSDAEIVDILGDPAPFQPLEPIEDHDAVLKKRFLKSVERWLIRKVSLADVRAALLTPDTHPSFRPELDEFVSAETESHDTWEFCSPQSEWNRLAGRSGFALVKDGEVTHVLVTMCS